MAASAETTGEARRLGEFASDGDYRMTCVHRRDLCQLHAYSICPCRAGQVGSGWGWTLQLPDGRGADKALHFAQDLRISRAVEFEPTCLVFLGRLLMQPTPPRDRRTLHRDCTQADDDPSLPPYCRTLALRTSAFQSWQ